MKLNRRRYFRAISFLLITLLMLGSAAVPDCAYAAAGETGSYTDEYGMTFKYMISGSEDSLYAVITGCDRDSVPEDGVVTVPGEVSGYPVRELGSNVFKSIDSMKKAVIPDGIEVIGEKCFAYSQGLAELDLGDSIRYIGKNAFNDTGIARLDLPESLETIGPSAFGFCTKLKEVNISSGDLSIASDAFDCCYYLEKFTVDPGNSSFTSVDGVLFTADGSVLVKYPGMLSSIEYEVPQGVQRISDYAFQTTTINSKSLCSLQKVVLPESLREIGAHAFSYTGITGIDLPSGVSKIGDYAFEYCSKMTEITLPDSAESIGEGAFTGCSSINAVNIPAGMSEIPSDAFSGCPGITAYNVEKGSRFFASEDGVLFDAGHKTLIKYPAPRKDSVYTVPDGIEKIGDYAFQKADWLESVVLPDSTVSIGSYAFSECYELRTVNLPDGLTEIGEYAFHQCQKLSSVGIPDSVKTIGPWAFYVTGLVSVQIPASVRTIEEGTFYFCSSLEKVTMMRQGTETIGDNAFGLCQKLREVYVPESVTEIGSDVLKGSGTALPDGESLKIVGFIGTAGEQFAANQGYVFERAVQPVSQAVAVSPYRTCIYGCSPFSLGAAALTAMTYESSNPGVAAVNKNGVVTITGVGSSVITVRARESNDYREAAACVTVNVVPAKATLTVKNIKRRKAKLIWGKVAGASGYEVWVKKPGKKKYTKRTTKNSNVKSITHSGLRKRKTYYYKVRAYTIVNGVRIYGEFSDAKKIKIRK